MERFEDQLTAALKEFRGYGLVDLQWITAQFEPFSSTERPDLVFWPNSGPNYKQSFVVEFRMPVGAWRNLPTVENLREHWEFTGADHFALATSHQIDENMHSTFSAHGIEVFDDVKSGVDLAARILRWSECRQSKKLLSFPKRIENLPLFPKEEIALPLAARSDSLRKGMEFFDGIEFEDNPSPHSATVKPKEKQAAILPPYPQNESEDSLTDNEVFRRVFDKYPTRKNSEDCFGKLQGFFADNDLGSFQDREGFLLFLGRTCSTYKCKSFEASKLIDWFREYNADKEVGSKP